jgi:hypothetical protein
VTSLDILNWAVVDRDILSTKDSLRNLREVVEQKLALVNEGTASHTGYLLFLDEIDRLLETPSTIKEYHSEY